MSRIIRPLNDRGYVQLLRRWRWIVLAIAIPISVVIEIIEGNSHDLQFLDEVIIDGLVLPVSTWIVLTFVSQKIVAQAAREETLEQRQQFMQRLAEHREYQDLTHYIVRFPITLLPIDYAALFIFDPDHARLNLVTDWNAAGSTDTAKLRALATLAVCEACRVGGGPQLSHTGACVFGRDPASDHSANEYYLPIAHETLVGVLRLRCQPGQVPTAGQLEFLTTLLPEIAVALDLAIADARQAERAYREAQIQERRRITHELHDTVAQQVFYLHLGLDQLAGNTALLASDAAQHKIESMRDVAAEVYEQVRNNLSILRAWEQLDLTEAISRLARVTAHNADLTIEIDVQGEPKWLSPHTCEDIYGIVREGLNNVVKHAQARHVQVDLIWLAKDLKISLVDDGVGFDSARLPHEGHYGLTLMREVIEALQGEFMSESRPGIGSRLRVSVPLRLPDPVSRQKQAWPQELEPALDIVP
jgi:signal transduction histidine kinase